MAAPSRYFGDTSNEFYPSSIDDYQNNIDQSLNFGHVPSSDFYLGPEMFFIPQMLGEQPYPSQPIFTGMESIYDPFQSQTSCAGASGSQTQLPSRALDENFRQISAEPRKSSKDTQNYYAMGDRYHEHDDDENLEHSRKKQRSSEEKKTQTASVPQENVFKLDLRVPSTSQAESQPITSQESLSSVFEVNVNQQPKRKARSAFTPQGKKKVEAVRVLVLAFNASLENEPEPCMLCIRRTGNVESAATLCTRESPFIELSIIEFYSSSYSKRIIDFNVDFSNVGGQLKTIKIDGKGPNSFPLDLKVIEVQTSSLSDDQVKEVCRITRTGSSSSDQQNKDTDQSDTITILSLNFFSSTNLEKWAMEYTYDSKLDNVNSTSFLFGVAYAKEKLPHADLVENMTKLISLNYMLYSGLKIMASTCREDTATQYPVLRAQLDTKLFNLLYNAEKLVCQELQRLVFKTSGQLAKDAIVPIALVLWLLTRLHSLKASHLITLQEWSDSPSPGAATSPASHQKHILNLLIGVLSALFRSSFPLLINFEEKCNRDLLGGNEDLIQLSKTLRRDLIAFKTRGYLKAWKWNNGFLKEQVDRLRDVLTE